MAFKGPVRALGGTAANIAVAAASLGTPVALVSHVGTDFPREFERLLRRRGVDLRHLVRVRGAVTPVCWIFSDTRERQVAFINQGAAARAGALPPDRRAVGSAQVVHLATGAPAHQLKVASLARRLGKSVSFDPGQELAYLWTPSTFRRALRFTNTLFLNDHERLRARSYLGVRSDRALLRFVDALVLTHGRQGAEFVSADEHASARAIPPRRIVNTTGAGDAFRGGYYAAAFRKLGAKDRLRWGAATASFVVESHGGQHVLPNDSQLQRRLRRTSHLLALSQSAPRTINII